MASIYLTRRCFFIDLVGLIGLVGLLCANLLVAQKSWADDSYEHLYYIASYQGVLSVGLKLDIAELILTLGTDRVKSTNAALELNTRNFSKVEMFAPVRFCYRSKFKSANFAAEKTWWWSQIGKDVSQGYSAFDSLGRKVLFRHVARKLTTWTIVAGDLKPNKEPYNWANAPDPDSYETNFVGTTAPLMDRLTVLQWLRNQHLKPGIVLDPLVSDGDKLLGFHVEVEAEDETMWGGQTVPSLRMRLQPQVKDQEDASPTWMWLSTDTKHLPLLFSSTRAFGAFQVRLVSATRGNESTCTPPKAAAALVPPPI